MTLKDMQRRQTVALESIAESLSLIAAHITAEPVKAKPKKTKPRDHTPEYSDEFEAFWKTYPRRQAKADAFAAWNQTVEAHPDDMMKRVKRFSASWMQRDRSELKYCPYPATWLRANGWEDDVNFNSKVRPVTDGHEININRIVQQEGGQHYADPQWREYKELVSAGKVKPGFLAWKEANGS